MDLEVIANNVKELRIAAGLSERELANLALCSEINLNRVEEGVKVPAHIVHRIAESLDTDLEALNTPRAVAPQPERIVTVSRKKIR